MCPPHGRLYGQHRAGRERALLCSGRTEPFSLPAALPFVDIDAPATHTYLTKHAARSLTELGVNNLDIAAVRGPNRLLTRTLAAWLYSQTDEHGQPLDSGVRYESRLGPYECWGIFDGNSISLIDEVTIETTSQALHAVASDFGLSIK